MAYWIYRTVEFKKCYLRLNLHIRKQVDASVSTIVKAPFSGRHIRYKYFREKRIGPYRLYYLVLEKHLVLLNIGHKNNQKHDIESIIHHIPFYRNEAEKISSRE